MAYINLETIALGIFGTKTLALYDHIYCPNFAFLIFQIKQKVQLCKMLGGIISLLWMCRHRVNQTLLVPVQTVMLFHHILLTNKCQSMLGAKWDLNAPETKNLYSVELGTRNNH